MGANGSRFAEEDRLDDPLFGQASGRRDDAAIVPLRKDDGLLVLSGTLVELVFHCNNGC